MALFPEARLVIVGHTDSVGDFYYNIDLAERRANAVREALVGEPYNVAEERLVAMGAGPIAPVASNLGEEGTDGCGNLVIAVGACRTEKNGHGGFAPEAGEDRCGLGYFYPSARPPT